MKIVRPIVLSKTVFAIFCVLLLSSCCNSELQLSTVEKVALYYIKDVTEIKEKDVIEAYFDFSDGMNWAYQNDTTKNILKDIVNKVSNESGAKIYSMADDQITLLPEKTTTLFNTIMSPASYSKQYAHIKFYITDYTENTQSKHLYYILFNTKNHSLQEKVKEAIKGQPKNYKEYLLSTNPCKLSTKYLGAAYGGCYHDSSNQDIVSGTDESGTNESYCNFNIEGYAATLLQNSRFFKTIPQLNAEYYPMGVAWPDIVKNAEGASELQGNERYTDLLRNLFVDLTNQDSYIVNQLDIIATDVQQDMDAYINSLMPQIVGVPEMVDDGSGGKVAAPTSDQELYYDDKGNVLPQYIYKAKPTSQIMDVFEMNQTLFTNTKKTDPSNVEIGIDLKSGFSGNIGGYTPGDMIRLDVVIAKCEPNISELSSLFSWGGNSNLADAIKNTLQNMKPQNRVVYSYFIKTTI